MKNYFIFLLLIAVEVTSAQTLNEVLNPMPQKIVSSSQTIKPSPLVLKTKNIDSAILQLLTEKFKNQNHKTSKAIPVYVGEKEHPMVKKYASKVPDKKEGYYLHINKKSIFVVGNDTRGTYYGVQTLLQLLTLPELPAVEIFDYPDIPFRGVVEGFYGTPWSHEKRLRQLQFYGENKLNTYIDGPKDDPYHSSPHWRMPYPEVEANQIKSLVDKANANFVDFVWAIHPGKDIQWNDQDRKAIIQKFEWMYEKGVRSFAVFFDDISGEGTNPEKQAALLNYIHNEFMAQKQDVNQLIMCPTEYNRSWSNPEKRYLEILGDNLHPSIQIMWTGNRVVADIDKETLEWINPKIKRKAYIWWNFPVSDYVRNHMLLGATYGNANDIGEMMSGFVSNPMEHPEASKIAVYGVADYTWNVKHYNPQKAWEKAIANIMPENQSSLLVFASHNSDLGANGHRYRREESVVFKPIADSFLKHLKENTENPQREAAQNEFHRIKNAAEELLQTDENTHLTEELHPWLLQFERTGALGLEVLLMYDNFEHKKYTQFLENYENAIAIKKQMYEIDQKHNQNPYQPGVETATLVVDPFINEVFTTLTERYNNLKKSDLKTKLNYNPNTLYTNIEQIKYQPLLQKGRILRISPVLEYVTVNPNDYFGISFEKPTEVTEIKIDLGNTDYLEKGAVQISTDGKDWTTLPKDWNKTPQNLSNLMYIRYVNKSNVTFEIQLKKFEIKQK